MAEAKLSKGGVISNLDLKEIDPATRSEAQQLEYQSQLMDEAKAEAKASPGAGFGVYLPGELESDGGEKTVAAQRAIQELSDRDIGQDPRAFPRAAIADPSVPGGFRWHVDERLYEAVVEGYRCPSCLQVQETPGSAICRWKYAKLAEVTGCGFAPAIDDFV